MNRDRTVIYKVKKKLVGFIIREFCLEFSVVCINISTTFRRQAPSSSSLGPTE